MEILTIILMILKWIGILLLSILGILILFIMIILLCPIKYHADGSYDQSFKANARVVWFWGIIRLQITYEDALKWCVKLFGRQILPKEPDKRKAVKNKKEKSKQKSKPQVSVSGQDEANALQNRTEDSQVPEIPVTKSENTETANAEDVNPEKKNKLHAVLNKILTLFEIWKTKIFDIITRLKKIRDDIDYYKKLLQRSEVKNTIINVLHMLGKIIRHIRPRKFRVVAHIGMDDPATTGQIMAIQGLLYPWIAERVIVFPYFEEKKMEGQFVIAGHTVLGVLLVCLLKVVINKDFLKLIRILRKKEVAENGRA